MYLETMLNCCSRGKASLYEDTQTHSTFTVPTLYLAPFTAHSIVLYTTMYCILQFLSMRDIDTQNNGQTTNYHVKVRYVAVRLQWMFTTSHLLSQLKNASCPDFTQKLHVDITKKHKTSRELHVRLLFSCAISQCIIHKQLYNSCNLQQELSYRQQIARQLRTQYAKGICRHTFYTVTLKKGHSRSLETEPLDRSYTTSINPSEED